ncbi:MAG TPA: hemin ABC transporter substrate-binding protein [Candidatus Sumerlaeota bacterium]|nr:hemin ABC transporter substrate-binding protein [Candidatus Sumerlaeota bacterium]
MQVLSFPRVGAFLVALLALSPPQARPDSDSRECAERIVSLGGTLTEIVHALGAGDCLVGVDQSSTYPPEVEDLPRLNYHRQVSAEGVLSLNPTLVLLTPEAGPPSAVQQLRDAGVRLITITGDDSTTGSMKRVEEVGAALGKPEIAAEIVRRMRADLEQAEAFAAQAPHRPRVLFIYARGLGTLMVGGRGTPADTMIRLAGGANATGTIEGFKPLTAEAVVEAAPDIVLMMSKGLESLGGREGLLSIPGVAQTPAAQQGRLILMDDLYLLGFGPRLGQAARDLAQPGMTTEATR